MRNYLYFSFNAFTLYHSEFVSDEIKKTVKANSTPVYSMYFGTHFHAYPFSGFQKYTHTC